MQVLSRTTIIVLLLTAGATISGCASMGGGKEEASPFEKNVRTVEEYVQEGDRAMRIGDFDAALIQYVLAIEGGDRSVDTLFKIGTTHRLQNNLALAEAGYRKALEVDREHHPSKEGLGLVYLKQEKFDQAEELLKQVTDSSEYQSAQAYNALGILYDLLTRYKDAEINYQAALSLVPNSARYHNNLGYSFYLQGDYDNAKRLYETSIGLDPNFDQAWANLALIHAKLGEQAQALSAFEQLGEKHQALNNLGYLNMLLGNKGQARKNLNESVARSPSYYNTAYKNLDSLALGKDEKVIPGLLRPVPANELIQEPAALGVPATVEAAREASTESADESQSSAAVASRTKVITNNRLESNEALVLQVQQRLNFLGYDPGPIDGKFGRKTTQALREFQRNNSFVVDGVLTNTLIDSLLSAEFSDGQVPNG